MKVIIAGSRHINDFSLLKLALIIANFNKDTVICGLCKGPDMLGTRYAQENNIELMTFPADWNKFGRRAGPIKNKQMSDCADALIALWDGKSPGTKDMINKMKLQNKLVYILNV